VVSVSNVDAGIIGGRTCWILFSSGELCDHGSWLMIEHSAGSIAAPTPRPRTRVYLGPLRGAALSWPILEAPVEGNLAFSQRDNKNQMPHKVRWLGTDISLCSFFHEPDQ